VVPGTAPKNPVAAAAMALRRFHRADDGVTAIEYGLLASLLAVMIIGAVTMAGSELKYTFDALTNSFADVNDTGSGGEGSDPETPEDSDNPPKDKNKDSCQKAHENCGKPPN